MRDPKLYINKSDLEQVFDEMGVEIDVEDLFYRCYKYRNKGILLKVPNAVRKRVATAITTMGNVELFVMVLTAKRAKLKHRFVEPKPMDKSWTTLTKISQDAARFCDVMELDLKQGYVVYIDIGLKLMGSRYSLNKFSYNYEKIVEKYNEAEEIGTSEYKDIAASLCSIYLDLHKHMTNQAKEVIRKNRKHDFILTAKLLVKHDWDAKNYIKFQFKHFDNMGIDLMPYHLHGDSAEERYILGTKSKSKDKNFEKFKRQKNSK